MCKVKFGGFGGNEERDCEILMVGNEANAINAFTALK
jgi:hypothetical protein